MFALLHRAAPKAVDRAAFRRRGQPGARIGGHPRPGPFGEREHQRVLRQFLGAVDVARHPRKRRNQPRPFDPKDCLDRTMGRSEEHTSELQSLMRISYAVFCLKKKKTTKITVEDKYQSQTTQQMMNVENTVHI